MRRNVKWLTIEQVHDVPCDMRHLQVTELSQRHPDVLIHYHPHCTFNGDQIGSFTNETELDQCLDHCIGITSNDRQEEFAQETSCIVSNRTRHAKVQKSNHRLLGGGATLNKNIARMWVGMKKALLKELVKICIYRASGNFHPVNFEGVKHSIVIDLDTIDPFKDNDVSCNVLFVHTWNINTRVIFEHGAEALGIGRLMCKINLFKN